MTRQPRTPGRETIPDLKTGALQDAIFNSAYFSSIATREEQDLLHRCQLGVNACDVKPMKFQDFVEAVRQVGAFWGVINEVPPGACNAS